MNTLKGSSPGYNPEKPNPNIGDHMKKIILAAVGLLALTSAAYAAPDQCYRNGTWITCERANHEPQAPAERHAPDIAGGSGAGDITGTDDGNDQIGGGNEPEPDQDTDHPNSGAGNGGEGGDGEQSPGDIDPGNSGNHNNAPDSPPGHSQNHKNNE